MADCSDVFTITSSCLRNIVEQSQRHSMNFGASIQWMALLSQTDAT